MLGAMVTELVPPDTGLAYEALRELRPHLVSCEGFVDQVDQRQRPLGYRLVAALPDGGGEALAVAGFRENVNLAWGRHLYVDDLSTVPSARGRGLARQLLDWIHGEADRRGCDQVHLDSGVGPTRATAHRLYLNSGYVISSHHFTRSR